MFEIATNEWSEVKLATNASKLLAVTTHQIFQLIGFFDIYSL
jgi:hypothetical protein